jgi:hypothetical protein
VSAILIVVGFVFLRGLYERGDKERVRAERIELHNGQIQVDVPGRFKLVKEEDGKETLHWGGPVGRTLRARFLDQDLGRAPTDKDLVEMLKGIHAQAARRISAGRYLLNYAEDLSEDGMTFRFNYWIVAAKGDRSIDLAIFIYSFLKKGEKERQVYEELELLNNTLPKVKFLSLRD